MMFSLKNHLHEAKRSGSDEAAIASVFKVFIAHARDPFRRQEHHDAFPVSRGPALSEKIIALLSGNLEEHILDADMSFKGHLEAARNRDRRLTGIIVRPLPS